MTNKFKVGDIVIAHSGGRSDGKRAFIEEIIRDDTDRPGLIFRARYSLYGLEPVKINESADDHPADYYFGDHGEQELEATGESMTVGQLQEFRKKLVSPQGDGFARDIDIIIKNLGRIEGRNEI